MERIGRLEQVAGVELLEVTDGAGRGVRVLQFRSGSGFLFEVLVDRGFDIGRAWSAGRPLAWWSPVGLTSPWSYDAQGVEWFRSWPGGLLSTCGLDHALLGGTDSVEHFNYPLRTHETYGLHGRYSGLPARLVGYGTSWHGDECVLWAEAEIRQAAVFGEQLVLERRIELDMGADHVRVRDTVTNVGFTACTHMMLYHCNIGFPVVDDKSELVYPSGAGKPVSEHRRDDYWQLTDPEIDYVEECYEHDMVSAADGKVSLAIVNRNAGLGVFQRYAPENLQHHITFRNLGQGTYVVGMEPSTNRDIGRFDARERGELQLLAPGESRRYSLDIGALVGPAVIESFIHDNDATIRNEARP